MRPDILPDLLGWGLRLVFCGTAAGPESARAGAYYAKPGNRFWPVLEEAGFTAGRLRPAEYPQLRARGIGLTDLAKSRSGVDRDLGVEDFDIDRFWASMRFYSPRAIAFTSQEAASIALGLRKADISFGARPGRSVGRQPEVFVLPSPSGNNGHWGRQKHHWSACARALGFAA